MYQMRMRYLLPPTGFKLWKLPCLTEEFQLNSKGKPSVLTPPCKAVLLDGRCSGQ